MSIWKLIVFTLHVTISLMAKTMCQFPEDPEEVGIVNSKEIISVSGKMMHQKESPQSYLQVCS